MSGSGEKKAKGNFKPVIDPKLVSALSHPLRGHILDVLSERDASPSDLARHVGLNVNYVAYHVKELEKAGFVELVKTEPRRGTVEHYYRAKRRAFIDDPEWERIPAPVRATMQLGVLQLIVNDAKQALAAETLATSGSHMSNTRLLVDEQGWDDLVETLSDTLERVLALQAECTERLEKSGEEAISVSVGLAGFKAPPRSEQDSEDPDS